MKKLAFILVLTPLLWGCTKKVVTTVTTVQNKFISAEINRYCSGTSYVDVALYSDPAPDAALCSAWAVAVGIPMFELTRKVQKPDGVWWYDGFNSPFPAEHCSLFVSSNIGSSRGGGSIPGTYAFLVPIPYDTLPWGDVQVSWTSSLYATWYDLGVSCFADSETRTIGSWDTTLILHDNMALIPLGFFRRYPSATSVETYLNLYAHGGMKPTPGGSGNMVGDIKGIFYSTFQDSGSLRRFFMGSPKLKRETTPPPVISREKRRQVIFRALGVPVWAGAD